MRLSRETGYVGLTLAVGVAGALAARAVNLPGGPLVGALVASGIVRLVGAPLEEPPSWLRSASRSVLGITIGATVTGETLRVVAGSLAPVAIMVVFMLVLGFATAWGLSRLARMPVVTALCGSAPGALSVMVTLADELGGSAPVVASMHLVRLVSVMLLMPPLVHGVFAPAEAAAVATGAVSGAADSGAVLAGLDLFWRQAALLAGGLALGALATRFKLPAGDLLAGMALTAVANPALLHLPDLPLLWKLFAQIVIGAGIGATISRETLADFKPFAVAGGVMTAILIASGLALALVLSRVSGLDLITCVVGCAPGGADTMIILADEFGANAPLVTAMHVSRMIILMVLLPPLINVAVKRGRAARPVAAGQAPGPSAQGVVHESGAAGEGS